MPTQSTWRTPYITEITLVRILPPYHAEQEEVLEIFRRRKKAFENFTKRPFHFMRQLDDPTLVYIIGEWASLEQHMTVWPLSSECQQLLEF